MSATPPPSHSHFYSAPLLPPSLLPPSLLLLLPPSLLRPPSTLLPPPSTRLHHLPPFRPPPSFLPPFCFFACAAAAAARALSLRRVVRSLLIPLSLISLVGHTTLISTPHCIMVSIHIWPLRTSYTLSPPLCSGLLAPWCGGVRLLLLRRCAIRYLCHFGRIDQQRATNREHRKSQRCIAVRCDDADAMLSPSALLAAAVDSLPNLHSATRPHWHEISSHLICDMTPRHDSAT